MPPFKRASSSSKPKERLKYGWDSAAAVVNAAKEVRLPAEQDIRLPAMQEGLPGTEAAATAAELLEKLADRTAAGTEAKVTILAQPLLPATFKCSVKDSKLVDKAHRTDSLDSHPYHRMESRLSA